MSVGYYIVDFVSLLLNFIFLFKNNVKDSIKVKIIEKPSFFAPKTLIFKLQQKSLEINDFYLSWSS